MQLSEYQKLALTTAIYPGKVKVIYPTLGLVGEVGEVANKVKKIYRDDGGELTDKKRDELAGELGDCCWYIATLASDLGIKLQDSYDMLRKYLPSLQRCVLKMASCAGTIAHRCDQWTVDPLFDLKLFAQYHLAELCWLCRAVAYHVGVEFGDILQANIDKLLSRKGRGVLQGSGDNR